MALRADITQLQQNVVRQLALDRQIILVGILQTEIGGKLSEEHAVLKTRPVYGRSARGIQDSRERIGENVAPLVHEGRLKQRIGNTVAATKRRFSAELLQH